MHTGRKDREIEARRNGGWIQASLRFILHNTPKFPAAPNPGFLVPPSSHFYKPASAWPLPLHLKLQPSWAGM